MNLPDNSLEKHTQEKKTEMGEKHPKLRFLATAVRWNDWFYSKIPLFLVALLYCILIQSDRSAPWFSIFQVIVLTTILILYACFGHIVNTYSDRIIDPIAGKFNPLAQLSESQGQKLVWLFALLTLLPALLFYWNRPDVIALVLLAIIVATIYSLPPLRCKEKGFWGLLTSAAAERILPVVIIFQAMQVWDLSSIMICLVSIFIGFRFTMIHQIQDQEADIIANVNTAATDWGSNTLTWWVSWVFAPLEIISLVIFQGILSLQSLSVAIVSLTYSFWVIFQLFVVKKDNEDRLSPLSYGLLSDWYSVYFPLLLAVLLAYQNMLYGLLLIMTILVVRKRLIREIQYIKSLLKLAFNSP